MSGLYLAYGSNLASAPAHGAGAVVHGALYRIEAADFAGRDAAEPGYERLPVQVLADGGTVEAVTYRAWPDRVDASLRPYRWYVELVVLGARHHALPAEYVAALQRVPVVDDADPERAAAMEALCRRLGACVP
ncbi:MAG TPA: gamma-glutamylcyclotransferase [Candidatus Limnocylindria bacterium]|nr:gamma-glutamylcyclotransferase [Candidatus Limnocylindria bacterium]